jgi:hypothetical protein
MLRLRQTGMPGKSRNHTLPAMPPHFVLATALAIILQGYFVSAGMLHVERYAPPPRDSAFSPRNIVLNFVSILLSLAFSATMSRLIDPLIDRCREQVRGQRLNV